MRLFPFILQTVSSLVHIQFHIRGGVFSGKLSGSSHKDVTHVALLTLLGSPPFGICQLDFSWWSMTACFLTPLPTQCLVTLKFGAFFEIFGIQRFYFWLGCRSGVVWSCGWRVFILKHLLQTVSQVDVPFCIPISNQIRQQK